MRLKELREERLRLATEARSILDAAEKDKRSLTTEEREKLTRLHAKIEEIKLEIEAEERQLEIEAQLNRPIERQSGREDRGGASADPAENHALERRAFASWMRHGIEGVTPEERAILSRLRTNVPQEVRALGSSGSAGGYTIPSTTRAEIISGMAAFGGMRRSRAEVITTDGGGPLHYPANNDTGNTGALLAENNAATEQDTTFTDVELDAYIYTSKIVRVPISLIQDSGVDIEAYVNRILAERLGRITETHYAQGDGSSKPRGITVAAANSSQTIDISDAVITVAALNGLVYSVDPAYRQNGQFMMHDQILKLISALSFSTTAQYGIWRPSLREGEPDLILGYPYVVNNSMPDAGTATNRPLVFGDLSAYKVRDVRDIIMMRLVERYAEYFQVGFVGFLRSDGDLVDPGTNPVKYAAMVA